MVVFIHINIRTFLVPITSIPSFVMYDIEFPESKTSNYCVICEILLFL